jgi:hypothetical protein
MSSRCGLASDYYTYRMVLFYVRDMYEAWLKCSWGRKKLKTAKGVILFSIFFWFCTVVTVVLCVGSTCCCLCSRDFWSFVTFHMICSTYRHLFPFRTFPFRELKQSHAVPYPMSAGVRKSCQVCHLLNTIIFCLIFLEQI